MVILTPSSSQSETCTNSTRHHDNTRAPSVFPPWNFDHWKAVDDRVRGGSSISHLDPIHLNQFGQVIIEQKQHNLHSQTECNDKNAACEIEHEQGVKTVARFWGNLDTQTLGGAGFASQCYRFDPCHPLCLPCSKYRGIRIVLSTDTTENFKVVQAQGGMSYIENPFNPTSNPVDGSCTISYPLTTSSSPSVITSRIPRPTTLTLVLKTHPPLPRLPNGRLPSSVTYETTLPFPSSCACGHADFRPHTIPWDAFKPFYRGKEVKKGDKMWEPLRNENIFEISLMCRSEFGRQEGTFGVLVESIQGWLSEFEEEKKYSKNHVKKSKWQMRRRENEKEIPIGCFTWLKSKWVLMRMRCGEMPMTSQKLNKKSNPSIEIEEKRLI